MVRRFDNVTTRDQLGRPEDKGFFNKRFSENIKILESPVSVTEDTIGHSWIVGSSTNGIVGTNTNTQDGQQQVVGSAGRVQTIKKVNSLNNIVYEKFTTTLFIDSASDALSGSGSATFTDQSILTSTQVYRDTNEISKVTLIAEGTNTSNLNFYCSTYPELAEDLELLYTFNDDNVTATTAYDFSGNGNSGTLTNYTLNDGSDTGVSYESDNPLDEDKQSCSFGGFSSSDYITITNDASIQIGNADTTIMCWVKLDFSSQTGYFYSTRNDTVGELSFGVNQNSGQGMLQVWVGNSNKGSSSGSVITGDWVHAALVYDSSAQTLTFYIDGIYDSQITSVSGSWDTSVNHMIGGRTSGTGYNPNGNIAFMRRWAYAMSESEIQSEMNSAYPVRGDNLVGSWDLNGDSKDTNYLVTGKIGQALRNTKLSELDVSSNTEGGDSFSMYGIYYRCQTFIPTSTGEFTKARVRIRAETTGTGNDITLELQETTSNEPNGSVLDSATYSYDSVTTDADGEWVTFTFSGGVTISTGTQYALVLKNTSGDSSEEIRWFYKSFSTVYPDGKFGRTLDAGTSWTMYTHYDAAFEVYIESGVDTYIQLDSNPDDIFTGDYNAAVFNGSTSKIIADYEDVSSGYAYGIWFKTANAGTDVIWGNGDASTSSSTNTFLCFNTSTTLYARSGNTAGTATAQVSATTDVTQWHYLFVTHDGTTLTMYLDGVLVDTDTGVGIKQATSTPTMLFGINMDGSSAPYEGNLAYARLWNNPSWTTTEIQSEMNSRTPVKTTNLVGAWALNEDSTDSVGSNDGTDTDMVYTGANPLGNGSTWTINMWSKADEVAGTGTYNYLFWRNDELPSIRCNETLARFMSDGNKGQGENVTFDYDDGSWHMYTFSYDGTNANGYIDGDLKFTERQTMRNLTSKIVRIGSDGVDGRAWSGVIDMPTIYSKALTQAEVTELYNSGSGTVSGWESVTNNTETSLSNTGTALLWKAEAATGTAKLTDVRIIYE